MSQTSQRHVPAQKEKDERPAEKHSKQRTAEELRKKIDALLEKIDALLEEHANDSCPKKFSPHIHLCDGTKIDLRKLAR